jgi:hypothetical protein
MLTPKTALARKCEAIEWRIACRSFAEAIITRAKEEGKK